MYMPPFKITAKIIELISRISEKIGEINSLENSPHHVELRIQNRIKTIHSSLAIESNSLSIEQITAIIEGKRVLGAPNEILEVKNAIQAYELLLSLNPYEEKDLLKAHSLMMKDLVNRRGKYRNDGVGIFDGDRVFVNSCSTANNGEIVVALIDDSATVKTFYKEKGHIRLQPENDTMDPIIVDDCQIMGKVFGVFRFYR